MTAPPRFHTGLVGALLCCSVIAGACAEFELPAEPPTDPFHAVGTAHPPSGVVETDAAGRTLTLWPFTGTALDGVASDPINLVFIGDADPRNVRAALMSLPGARPGPFASFDCRWTDAMGGAQTAFSADGGWEGSVVQLECGDYRTIRFHVRLFRAGDRTVGNAHLDVLIPDTPFHQVLSWELARQFVVAEFVRTGLLAAAPSETGRLYGPDHRSIPQALFNALPPELRALVTGSPALAPGDVPLATSGRASVLAVGGTAPATPTLTTQELELRFGRVIPAPICNPSGQRLVLVTGPIRQRLEVRIDDAGVLSSQYRADGDLMVADFDPMTGAIGVADPASTRDHAHAHVHDRIASMAFSQTRHLRRAGAADQRSQLDLLLGPNGLNRFSATERCGD